MALLEVENLNVAYGTIKPVRAVRDVSLMINEGEFVGLLGESGSGKTTLGNAILRLLDPPARITSGSIRFAGTDITTTGDAELRALRWRDISTVFQSSMNSLNPVLTVEAQFRDVIQTHTPLRQPGEIRDRIGQLLEMVMLDPSYMRFYPHELSGGMKQRACIALALALEPSFVLLDEPTTGLDVVVQRSILDNLRALQRERGFAVLLISHDLGMVMEVCDRIMVMYAGQIVEHQEAKAALKQPLHPYTRGLLGSYADPRAESVSVGYISGRPPHLSQAIDGCAFAPRCGDAISRCWSEAPKLLAMQGGHTACHVAELRWLTEDADVQAGKAATTSGTKYTTTAADREQTVAKRQVLNLDGVSKSFTRRRGMRKTIVDAVRDVSFSLYEGHVTALVGQSGSGKSTIAKLITGVERPDSGSITFGGKRVDNARARGLRRYRQHIQLVFQDPFAALNPVKPVGYALSRPLRNYANLSAEQARHRAEELLETVGLSPPSAFMEKFPHQLSGGQCQRVVVARALASDPEILVADEPISMLDVSIRAEILELLDGLVRDRGIAMLYITHDLLSARVLADSIIVLKDGRIVESGPALDIVRHSTADYTRLLLASLPDPYGQHGSLEQARTREREEQ
jgi:peptide/nickel transport system ATP-binding protein